MQKTLFASALSALNLTIPGAAKVLDVRPDTVKSWSADRRSVPDGAWETLRILDAEIETLAEEAEMSIRASGVFPKDLAMIIGENGGIPKQHVWVTAMVRAVLRTGIEAFDEAVRAAIRDHMAVVMPTLLKTTHPEILHAIEEFVGEPDWDNGALRSRCYEIWLEPGALKDEILEAARTTAGIPDLDWNTE